MRLAAPLDVLQAQKLIVLGLIGQIAIKGKDQDIEPGRLPKLVQIQVVLLQQAPLQEQNLNTHLAAQLLQYAQLELEPIVHGEIGAHVDRESKAE